LSDITDAVGRMQELNAALSDWDRIREEGERISREEAYRVLALEIATLHAESERLRLTDAEREAIAAGLGALEAIYDDPPQIRRPLYDAYAPTLQGLLERTQFAIREPDSPQPIATCDTTPHPHATPAVCTVPPQWTSRPYWVDPPSGWRYGFPRLYDPATDGDMVEWMISNGYPETLARQGLACTFTEWKEDVR
jgi:hypothetical protein